jgi:phosphatidylinositol glycan class W
MSPDADAAAVRRYSDKEEFVTGHAGTTPLEVFLLCLVVPVGLCLYLGARPHVVARLGGRRGRVGGGRGGVVVVASVVFAEFLTLILPMLMVQTSLLPRYAGPCLLLGGMSILASSMGAPPSSSYGGATTGGDAAAGERTTRRDVREDVSRWTYRQLWDELHELNVPIERAWRKQDLVDWLQNHHLAAEGAASITSEKPRRRPASLSVHRACVYVLTTIAILAVDFPIFPRRFCKTERVGYGWMDLGAASFVVIAGWTSAVGGDAASTSAGAASSIRRKFFRKCIPLLSLGFVRLATNKGLEYQEHVSEYGVHWNFFFTLCCVEGFMVVWKGVERRNRFLADAARTRKYSLDCALALSLIVPYQLFLSSGGQEFIENGDRRCGDGSGSLLPGSSRSFPLCDAFVANREGVLGVVGYLSLRLLSEAVAGACMAPVVGVDSECDRDDASAGRQRRLFVTASGLWMAHLLLTAGLGMPNSRRSTNAPFVLWSLAHNVSLLGLIQVVVTRTPSSGKDGNEEPCASIPRILEAVNRFGLAVFLSSNLLTGLVNLTVDTLHSSDGKAVFILSLYLGLVCGFALLLDAVLDKEKFD